ncbi:hypothetical protein PoB_005463800 [Plakobranchus ocellatus]|uniref:Uncharacterized protein n=1 Tax=Plakobranchus ocellatus TaxID=259542 RepID=A0AAV4C8E1_9GAST|nr:hypothetical protein PoB_005463800 [Plakobranchus ocellatus]
MKYFECWNSKKLAVAKMRPTTPVEHIPLKTGKTESRGTITVVLSTPEHLSIPKKEKVQTCHQSRNHTHSHQSGHIEFISQTIVPFGLENEIQSEIGCTIVEFKPAIKTIGSQAAKVLRDRAILRGFASPIFLSNACGG